MKEVLCCLWTQHRGYSHGPVSTCGRSCTSLLPSILFRYMLHARACSACVSDRFHCQIVLAIQARQGGQPSVHISRSMSCRKPSRGYKGGSCIHMRLLGRQGPRVVQAGANMVEVRGATVTVRDGDRGLRNILNSANFSLKSGELHMLVGPNGCGKVPLHAASTEFVHCPAISFAFSPTTPRTPAQSFMQSTLLRTIGGLSAADAGTVEVVRFLTCTACSALDTSPIEFNLVDFSRNTQYWIQYDYLYEREVCCVF